MPAGGSDPPFGTVTRESELAALRKSNATLKTQMSRSESDIAVTLEELQAQLRISEAALKEARHKQADGAKDADRARHDAQQKTSQMMELAAQLEAVSKVGAGAAGGWGGGGMEGVALYGRIHACACKNLQHNLDTCACMVNPSTESLQATKVVWRGKEGRHQKMYVGVGVMFLASSCIIEDWGFRLRTTIV